ncbi:hypothetical protein KIH74_12035 [Kineosporia sp. J2-2]|uniref:Uncharacterized protein n=1 Tax=Kineosporia corallincola TaxID=2835133 RepID=A0ABS5TEZ5_9ACTN|nr:hypothetical protein [Kineosporia corallincola]MBT0769657.1 hypothetical protein [Kineosporia corallincola]
MSESTTAGGRLEFRRMPHHRAAGPSVRELRDLPEPRPRKSDWVVLWPFSVCLPLDSHYCCVHAHPQHDDRT